MIQNQPKGLMESSPSELLKLDKIKEKRKVIL